MKTPDRGPSSASGHESESGHGPVSISGREVAALESAREDPPPGPGYWVANGHLPDCPYLRSLDYFDDEEQDCDCVERRTDDEVDQFWDEDDDA